MERVSFQKFRQKIDKVQPEGMDKGRQNKKEGQQAQNAISRARSQHAICREAVYPASPFAGKKEKPIKKSD